MPLSDQPLPIQLTRAGHYFMPRGEDVPLSGSCQEAVVVDTSEPNSITTDDGDAVSDGPWTVNLVGHTHEGNEFTRLNVPFEEPSRDHASFHLSQTCPWGR